MILRRKHIVFAALLLLAGCGLSQQQTDQITLLHGLNQQVNSKDLVPGANQTTGCITDSLNERHCLKMEFTWDPSPVGLPLELVDLSQYESIQEIGQVVNGNFLINHDRNVIRTQAPVAKDALLLLGSSYGSQKAFYKVRFSGLVGAFVGLSDFFAGHEEAEPAIGIKPGWSIAGLATRRGTDQTARV